MSFAINNPREFTMINRLKPKPTSIEAINAAILESAAAGLEHAATIPATAYTSQDYFEYEKETIFKQEWLCLAHVSQIPKPGSYLNLDVLGEPIVVVRAKDNTIRVMSRVCPHRAMDIMPTGFGYDERGQVKGFMCPYHSWTFALDGKLKGAPAMQKTCDFNRKDFGLVEFRSEVWEGFVFMTFNFEADPVATQLVDLHPLVAPWHMADMDIVTEIAWDLDINWKNMIENWMEPYHHMGIHVKTLQPMMPATGCWTDDYHPHYTRAHLPYRQSLIDALKEAEEKGDHFGTFPPIPGLPEDYKYEWTVHVGYPDFLMLTGPNCALWYRLLPISAEKIHLVTTILVNQEAQAHPDFEQHLAEETQALKDFHSEDIEVCTAVQRGFNSIAFQPGRMSHLEKPVHQIQRYLASRIQATDNVPDGFSSEVPAERPVTASANIPAVLQEVNA
ncbi:MAG: aromatic ring-hydroxylating dioxygenase subunit alpha [Cyanobacteria bacterium J06560_6]